MPRIIVTSRYLKSGSAKNLSNYVKYIATRTGVVKDNMTQKNVPATDSQKELIQSLLNDFTLSNDLTEYEVYKNKPTSENASRLICKIIDNNLDRVCELKNFVGYIANRPGAVKSGSHGLFSFDNKELNLEQIATEVSQHKGNVWTHVISLRRDDAQKMGYDNLNAWRDLVRRQIPKIAEEMKIDMESLKWYAAFHDKKNNPHVHIIVYSEKEGEGFLTQRGIEKIRSAFVNDIYHDELMHLYSDQTDLRNLLKKQSDQTMRSFIERLKNSGKTNTELLGLVKKLSVQLQNTKGKKVYGFLPPVVKQTVNDIFSLISNNDSIKEMYKLWCEMEQQKHDMYSSAKVEFPSLVDNKEFKSVKNMIIQSVINMQLSLVELSEDNTVNSNEDSIEIDVSTPTSLCDEEPPINVTISTKVMSEAGTPYIKWSTGYKSAVQFLYNKNSTTNDYEKAKQTLISESEKGNVLATHDLGKFYATDKFGRKDEEKSFEYYSKSLAGFMKIEPLADCMYPYEPKFPNQRMKAVDMRDYIQYRIGKMHCYGLGTEQDYEKSFEWFQKSADNGNKFAQYSLANQYYYGNGIEKDLSLAFEWYRKSSLQGQPYASYSVAQMYSKGEYVDKDNEVADRYYSQALAGFLKIVKDEQADDNLFYKLGCMYKRGLGTDIDMKTAVDLFKQSAELNNKNALYEYGKALLTGTDIEKDIPKAMECLEKAIELGNKNAKRFYALELISGESIDRDIERGMFLLTECADEGDINACYRLGKIFMDEKLGHIDYILAEKYLLLASAEDNPFAEYALGKLYLTDEKRDIAKAVSYFEKCSADNSYACYALGKLYLFGAESIEQDKEVAIQWFTKSAELGNEYAQNLLDHIDDYQSNMLSDCVFGLLSGLCSCIVDDYRGEYNDNRRLVDHKLRIAMRKQKRAMGVYDEQEQLKL